MRDAYSSYNDWVLRSVLAPLFPEFSRDYPRLGDVNWPNAEEGELVWKKPSASSAAREARGASIATAPALPVIVALPSGNCSHRFIEVKT